MGKDTAQAYKYVIAKEKSVGFINDIVSSIYL